jgi:hypothetical protein
MRWRLVGLAAATFALVSACGSGDPNGSKVASLSDAPTPSEQQQTGNGNGSPDEAADLDKMRDFAKCMREHGINMADPQSGPDGGGVSLEVHPGEEDKVKAAQEACKHLMPNGGAPPKLDAQQLDELRKQAQCMREHGVDMADPDPNNPGITIKGSGDEEKDKKAFEECGLGKRMGPGGGTASKDAGSGNSGGGK